MNLTVDGASLERTLDWGHLVTKGKQLFRRAAESIDRLGELRTLVESFAEVGTLQDLTELVLP